MYLGFGLALLALVIFVGNAFSVLVVPAYVAYMNRFQIAPEERALLAKFGPPFRDYMAKVRRWL
jgi:protein-S-isoprenylcysteine O-methyltransferase Ste14